MSLVEDLKTTREWLSEPTHWLKDGRYSSGNIDGLQATCLIGAVWLATNHSYFDPRANDAIRLLETCIPDGRQIPDWNDDLETSHDDLLHVLDCAIDKAAVGAEVSS